MVSGVFVRKGTGVKGSDNVGEVVMVISGTGPARGEVGTGAVIEEIFVPEADEAWQADNRKKQKNGKKRKNPMGLMAEG